MDRITTDNCTGWMMLPRLLNYLRYNRMPDTVLREITGNNIPHVAIVRNADEFVDQSISQFGNTLAFFGSGWVLDKLIGRIPKIFSWTLNAPQKTIFDFGKSLSIFSFIASVNMGMPFLRNAITTQRTQTTKYADMIGETDRKAMSQEDVEKTVSGYLKRFKDSVVKGTAVSAGIITTTVLAITSGKRLKNTPKALSFIHKHIGLKEGKFKNFSPLSAVLFWVIPTFYGLLSGARDSYEVKELALRFAAFNLAFFIFPHTIEKAINKIAAKTKPTKLFGAPQNLAYLGRFFSSLIFCSAVPTVLNIYLTHQRVKQNEQKQILNGMQLFQKAATLNVPSYPGNFALQPSALQPVTTSFAPGYIGQHSYG